jgi:hypothetical protein
MNLGLNSHIYRKQTKAILVYNKIKTTMINEPPSWLFTR